MINLSRSQRRALLRIWLRTQDERETLHLHTNCFHPQTKSFFHSPTLRQSYRCLRRQLHPVFDNTGAVLVPFAGMYLGIERDGYTHS